MPITQSYLGRCYKIINIISGNTRNIDFDNRIVNPKLFGINGIKTLIAMINEIGMVKIK